MPSYVIKCHANARGGVVEQTLGEDNQWYTATNQARKFANVTLARRWFFSDHGNDIPLRGSFIWVHGPRGGYYPMRRP